MSNAGTARAENDPPFHVGFVFSPHPHASSHMQTLEVLEPVDGVHLCGLEDAAQEYLGQRLAKVRSFTSSVDELLSREEVDALLVCVRNDLYLPIFEAAINAGKPVLFEKPGALTAADLRRVADLASRQGLTFGAMLNFRWEPAVQEVRQAIGEGALGRIMAVEARQVASQVRYRDPDHWLFKRATAGSGIISWLACHPIDTLCYLLDERVVEVSAMVGSQNPERIEVEDTACVVLRFASGVLGTLHAGYLLAGSRPGYFGGLYDPFLAIRGTEGYVRLPSGLDQEYTLRSVAPGWASGGQRQRIFQLPDSPAFGGVAGEEFFAEFLRAARAGEPAPCPIEDAVHLLEIAEAAIESSSTGRAVRIPPP